MTGFRIASPRTSSPGSCNSTRDQFGFADPALPVPLVQSRRSGLHRPAHRFEFRWPGTLQKSAVEVRSVRGFQGSVSLCDGLDDQVGYAFSPATVTLDPAHRRSWTSSWSNPSGHAYGFYVHGDRVLVHTELGILELTTLPSLEVNSDCSWMAVKVGQTAHLEDAATFLNGYQGPVDLTDRWASAVPRPSSSPQPGVHRAREEVEVLCSSLIQDGIEGYIIRVAPEFT